VQSTVVQQVERRVEVPVREQIVQTVDRRVEVPQGPVGVRSVALTQPLHVTIRARSGLPIVRYIWEQPDQFSQCINTSPPCRTAPVADRPQVGRAELSMNISLSRGSSGPPC